MRGHTHWSRLKDRLDLSDMVVFEANVGDCWVCGAQAHYLDLSFDAPVCGGVCVWASWEALRLHDTPWRAW
jgi:hypothetical protein